MMHFADHLLQTYGYGVITLAIAIECAGLLVPGETVFVGGAIYASTTHHIGIFLVILAAATGAILGNLIGFSIGRRVGAPVLARHGGRIGLSRRRLALGRYLFRMHGGKVVFFCRFVSVLRSFNALLAGASEMPVRRFLAWTVASGIAWPVIYGSFAYLLGDAAHRLSAPLQWALGLVTVLVVIRVLRFIKSNETRLEDLAMQSEHYERYHA